MGGADVRPRQRQRRLEGRVGREWCCAILLGIPFLFLPRQRSEVLVGLGRGKGFKEFLCFVLFWAVVLLLARMWKRSGKAEGGGGRRGWGYMRI